MTYRTIFISLVALTTVLSGGMPAFAQERCTATHGLSTSCVDSSTCNTVTGKCERNENVTLGGACLHDDQCASGNCIDQKCVPAGTVQSVKDEGSGDTLVNLLSVDTAEELVVLIIDLMVQVGTILLVFALVLAGFRFVSAQGNPGAVEEARKSLFWVVMGGLLLLGAEAISLVIKATVESL